MDEKIIDQIINGDIQAFKQLVSKYKNPSYNLARSILESELIAEEAVQDAFIKAFQNLHKFRKKAAFSTWFYRIVLNESLKKAKKRKLEFTGSLDDLNHTELYVEPEAINSLHREEQRELIQQVISHLSNSESLMLKLFYLEEKTLDEIVTITELKLNHIKVILHRARKHFAELYTAELKTHQI